MESKNIRFDTLQTFQLDKVELLKGIVGLYFISLEKTRIEYPFKASKLIYIGMSEKKTNSIRSRLSGHHEGLSGNLGIVNYKKREPLLFTHINFEMLKKLWTLRIEDLESYFLLDFVKKYGCYPICNNKTGFEVLKSDIDINWNIDWGHFD